VTAKGLQMISNKCIFVLIKTNYYEGFFKDAPGELYCNRSLWHYRHHDSDRMHNRFCKPDGRATAYDAFKGSADT
jgi:hypothetical protein